jgi:hypothetical protein
MKQLWIGAGLVAVLAVSVFAVAVAGAQEDTPTPLPDATEEEDETRPCDTYRDLLAENLGIGRDELDGALRQTQLDMIDQAVADGKLTEDEAADLKEKIEGAEDVPCPGFHWLKHKPFFRGLHWLGENTAEILGISEEDLRSKVADGMSLAGIAEEQGMSVDDLKADLLESARSDLDEKVADGDITQEQADDVYQKFSDNIDRIVNATPGDRPFFDGPRHDGRGGLFPGGPFGEGFDYEGGTDESGESSPEGAYLPGDGEGSITITSDGVVIEA